MVMEVKDVFQMERKIKKALEDTVAPKLKKRIMGVMVRVSTDRQAIEGDSLDMQQELAQQLAEEKDGVIYEYYVEDGLSASKTRVENRSEVQRLMQDIEDGKVNCVVAYKRDRMFRNALENMEFLQFLVNHNCELFLTARGEMQVDLVNLQGMGQIMEYILATFSQMESATTSARVSDTMISIALKGERTGGNLPIGYYANELTEMFEPINEAIPLFRQIEDMYLAGVGRGSISKWLNGGTIANYPTLPYPVPKPYIKKYKKASEEWNTSNIETILFNPIYTGHNSYQSKKIEDMNRIIVRSDKIVPIRTLEKQKEINDLAYKKKVERKPPRAYNTPFLLTGMLFCKECGGKYVTTTSATKQGVRRSYYRCDNKHNRGSAKRECKHSKNFRKEMIENIVLDVVKKTLSEFLDNDTYELFQKKVESIKNGENKDLEMLDKKIAEKQTEFDNITKLVSKISDVKIQLEYVETQSKILNNLNELKETRGILSEKLELDTEESYDFAKFLELAKEFGHIIECSSIGVQKLLLEGLINTITVDKKGNINLELGISVAKKYVEETNIGLARVGEPTMLKDILVSSANDDWNISINYYDILKRMYNKANHALYPFLQSIEPRFTYENHYLIDTSELITYSKPRQSSFIRQAKVHTFMEEKYGINKTERERIMNHTALPSIERIKGLFELLGTSVEEFIYYTKKRYTGFLEGGDMILEEIILSYKGKSVGGKYLFENTIKCACCGEKYTGRKSVIASRYLCKNNRADRGDRRCLTTSVSEPLILEKIKKDLKLEEIRRQDIVWKVENIIVKKNGKFTINYKNI